MFSNSEKKTSPTDVKAALDLQDKISDKLHEIAEIRIKDIKYNFYYQIFGLSYVDHYLVKDMATLDALRKRIDRVTVVLANVDPRDIVQDVPKAKELLTQLKNSYDEYIISLHKINLTRDYSLEDMHLQLLKHEASQDATVVKQAM